MAQTLSLSGMGLRPTELHENPHDRHPAANRASNGEGRPGVTLETVLAAFAAGATSEEIAQQYPSILLADVYQVIGYWLRHSSELEPYLARRRQDVRETRRLNESRWPPDGIRDRLLVRRHG